MRSNAGLVRTWLIKPGRPFDETFNRLRGDGQSRRRESVSQKVKPAADAADECFIWVFLRIVRSILFAAVTEPLVSLLYHLVGGDAAGFV